MITIKNISSILNTEIGDGWLVYDITTSVNKSVSNNNPPTSGCYKFFLRKFISHKSKTLHESVQMNRFAFDNSLETQYYQLSNGTNGNTLLTLKSTLKNKSEFIDALLYVVNYNSSHANH